MVKTSREGKSVSVVTGSPQGVQAFVLLQPQHKENCSLPPLLAIVLPRSPGWHQTRCGAGDDPQLLNFLLSLPRTGKRSEPPRLLILLQKLNRGSALARLFQTELLDLSSWIKTLCFGRVLCVCVWGGDIPVWKVMAAKGCASSRPHK